MVKMIIVDSNERDTVTKYLDERKTAYRREVIKIDDVGVGDYTNDTMSFLAERKSAFDFRQSVISGHLEVQLARMVRLYDGPKYLIFEGDLDALVDAVSGKGLKMLIRTFPLRLAHVYGTHFIQCYDPLETAQTLEMLDRYTKGIRDPSVKFEPIYMSKTYDERVRALLVVPRLGQKKAELLLDRFKSIAKILAVAIKTPKDLTNIDGIGKVTVKHIVDLYAGTSPFVKNKNKQKKKKKRYVDNKDAIANRKKMFAAQKQKYEMKARSGKNEPS